MYWQFQIDGRPAGPIRGSWEQAAQDAVNDGYAIWYKGGIAHDDQAAIVRVNKKPEQNLTMIGV